LTKLTVTRRQGLGIMGGASASVFMPVIANAQATDIQVHYSMPAIFKEAQDAVMEAFKKKHPEMNATYVNPTPTYEDGAQLLLRNAATGQTPEVYR
jgi:multiple sugar transport system substrate-binding protein